MSSLTFETGTADEVRRQMHGITSELDQQISRTERLLALQSRVAGGEGTSGGAGYERAETRTIVRDEINSHLASRFRALEGLLNGHPSVRGLRALGADPFRAIAGQLNITDGGASVGLGAAAGAAGAAWQVGWAIGTKIREVMDRREAQRDMADKLQLATANFNNHNRIDPSLSLAMRNDVNSKFGKGDLVDELFLSGNEEAAQKLMAERAQNLVQARNSAVQRDLGVTGRSRSERDASALRRFREVITDEKVAARAALIMRDKTRIFPAGSWADTLSFHASRFGSVQEGREANAQARTELEREYVRTSIQQEDDKERQAELEKEALRLANPSWDALQKQKDTYFRTVEHLQHERYQQWNPY